MDEKTKVTTFRRVLLTKCQQEFEKDKKDDEEREEMLSAIEKAETVRDGGREGGGCGVGGTFITMSVPKTTFVYLTTSEMRTPHYSGHFNLTQ